MTAASTVTIVPSVEPSTLVLLAAFPLAPTVGDAEGAEVGANEVGRDVVGSVVAGVPVVGIAVLGPAVLGADVAGAAVVGDLVEGTAVVGTEVVGDGVMVGSGRPSVTLWQYSSQLWWPWWAGESDPALVEPHIAVTTASGLQMWAQGLAHGKLNRSCPNWVISEQPSMHTS